MFSQPLNTVDFEVPQKRKQLTVIAVMGSLTIPEVVGSGKPKKTIRDTLKGCQRSPGTSYSRVKAGFLMPSCTLAVDTLVERCTEARDEAEAKNHKNVVDPFSCLTVASTFNIETADELLKLQKHASTLSGIANAIGNFHQNILSSVNGWVDHDADYGLESVA